VSRSSRIAKHEAAKNAIAKEHFREGRELKDVAKDLGYSPRQMVRIKKEVGAIMQNETRTEMQLYRDDQLARVAEKWNEIVCDQTMSGAEKHLAWSRWMKLEMDLRGTAAPSRSVATNVNVDAEAIGPYRKFVQAVSGLDEQQIEQLFLMAREMPRRPFAMVEPPKTSPLWIKNQLTEGDDANS
jgi:hypothetical protein